MLHNRGNLSTCAMFCFFILFSLLNNFDAIDRVRDATKFRVELLDVRIRDEECTTPNFPMANLLDITRVSLRTVESRNIRSTVGLRCELKIGHAHSLCTRDVGYKLIWSLFVQLYPDVNYFDKYDSRDFYARQRR